MNNPVFALEALVVDDTPSCWGFYMSHDRGPQALQPEPNHAHTTTEANACTNYGVLQQCWLSSRKKNGARRLL